MEEMGTEGRKSVASLWVQPQGRWMIENELEAAKESNKKKDSIPPSISGNDVQL